MRYKKIKVAESVLNMAFALCAMLVILFHSFWLILIAHILLVSDLVAMAFMIYAFREKNKSFGATLKECLFSVLLLVFVYGLFYYVAFILD